MKYISVLAVLALLFAAPATYSAPKLTSTTKAFICPVTGETIPSIKDAAGHSVYKGKTYYFCCSDCKPLFDANPSKYVSKLKGKSATP